MRVHIHGDTTAGEFAKMLLKIGDGRIEQDSSNANGLIQLPFGNMVKSIDELREAVYPNLQHNYHNKNWLCERAILASTNEAVNQINYDMQKLIPGNEHVYKSINCALRDVDAVEFPPEFLNSIEMSQLQPARLSLKVGSPSQTHEEGVVSFKRIQFPVKLCFSMTINKAQGQTLGTVGVDLRSPCFAHGQLYVACSRVGKASNLYILSDGNTKNIVNQRALKD